MEITDIADLKDAFMNGGAMPRKAAESGTSGHERKE
jgi:hypothetical protein